MIDDLKFRWEYDRRRCWNFCVDFHEDWFVERVDPRDIEESIVTGIVHDGMIIGYLWMSWAGENTGWLSLHICLHPDYRGRVCLHKIHRAAVSTGKYFGARGLVALVECELRRKLLEILGWHTLTDRIMAFSFEGDELCPTLSKQSATS